MPDQSTHRTLKLSEGTLQSFWMRELSGSQSHHLRHPIVVVRKKNGQIRLCIDYRRLNLQTIKDAYNLPKLEDTFSALNGSQWFSVLNLKSGYYQIEVEEADKPKTAFVCPLGFWEFNRMPQGVDECPQHVPKINGTVYGGYAFERCIGFP